MKRNKLTISKGGRSSTSAIITGVIAASLISVLLTALAANLILNGQLGEKSAAAVSFTIRAISQLGGALIGALLLKRNYLKMVGFITAGYLLVLTGTGIVFFDGSFKNFLLALELRLRKRQLQRVYIDVLCNNCYLFFDKCSTCK